MACSLRVIVLFIAAFSATMSIEAKPVAAAEMDKNAKADAKTAMLFYKEGNYEDAAKVFLRLSIAYPDMLVFVRNLGACYYYMRRYEPALSNLRDYEHRKRDIAPDDRAEVAGWIGEMERLRDQAMATAAAPPPAAPSPVLVAPVVAPAVPPAVASAPAVAPAAPEAAPSAPGPALPPATPPTAAVPSPSTAPPTVVSPAQPGENAYPQQGAMGNQPAYAQGQYGPQPAYPQGQYGPQPAYPQGQYGPQPAYPQGQYGPQPGYVQGQYGAQPAYPNTQYPTTGGGYPPTSQPATYPPGGPAAAGVAAPAAQQQSSGGARKAVAWILGIAGVGSAGVGGYFAAKALDDFSKVEKKYDPSLEKQGKTEAKTAWILGGAGVAALTVAIIVGASGGSSPPAVALAPVVGPGAAGATLSGSF